MQIDLNVKAQELLQKLANSIYDRDQKMANEFSFNQIDIELTKEWLCDFIEEVRSD